MRCVQIYTGNGKGKTTAALGLTVRAVGSGLKVRFIQFLKQDGCGEHSAMAKLGVKIDSGYKVESPPWVASALEEWREHTRCQWQKACEALDGEYDIIILDEVLGALRKGLISLQEVLLYVERSDDAVELVLTGRDAPRELIAKADLVSEITPIKHYMDSGVGARRGIEY